MAACTFTPEINSDSNIELKNSRTGDVSERLFKDHVIREIKEKIVQVEKAEKALTALDNYFVPNRVTKNKD
jgi:hypothetical protein